MRNNSPMMYEPAETPLVGPVKIKSNINADTDSLAKNPPIACLTTL